MGRYAITAQFQPFSFQERIAPLQAYKQEYDNVTNTLATLGEEAGALQQYLDPNSESGQKVQAYNSALEKAAQDLSANGLKAVSRNALFNLRRQYNGDIAKIKSATANYQTMQDTLRKASIQDPTLMIGNVPTVDDLVRDPNAKPFILSGDKLFAQAAGIGSSLDLNSTQEDVLAAMQQVAESSGIENLANPEQALSIIQSGILNGLGAKRSKFAEEEAKLAMKNAYAKDLARYKGGITAANQARAHQYKLLEQENKAKLNNKKSGKSGSGGSGTLHNVGTTSMIFERDRDTSARMFVDKKTGALTLSDKLFKDGKLVEPEKYQTIQAPTGQQYNYQTKENRQYEALVDMLGKYYSDEEIANMSRSQVENAIKAINDDASLDANNTSQLRWNLDAAGTKRMLNMISNNGDAKKIKDRKSNGELVYGKTETLKYKTDAESELRYDPQANELILKYQNEYYQIPKSILSNEILASLATIVAPGTTPSGKSNLENTQELIKTTKDYFAQRGISEDQFEELYKYLVQNGLQDSPEAQLIDGYFKQLQNLDDYDAVLGDIPMSIMEHIGSKNINK